MMKKLILLLFVFWGCWLSSPMAFAMNDQANIPPSYQFQSTSTCPSAVGQSAFAPSAVFAPGCSTPAGPRSPRRSGSYNPWDEDGNGEIDTGDPTGEAIGQINTPVGSPMVLLLMAVAYLCVRYTMRHRRRAQRMMDKH